MGIFAKKKHNRLSDMTEKEFMQHRTNEFQKLQVLTSKDAIERFKQEIEILNGIKAYLDKDDVTLDEMVMQLHNIICIVPEEQYRFLDNLRALFDLLPADIKNKQDVLYVTNKLNVLSKESLASKLQFTDISMYWTSYRRTLYTYGIMDNHQQRKIQLRMRDKMLRIIKSTTEKRSRGIETACKFAKTK